MTQSLAAARARFRDAFISYSVEYLDEFDAGQRESGELPLAVWLMDEELDEMRRIVEDSVGRETSLTVREWRRILTEVFHEQVAYQFLWKEPDEAQRRSPDEIFTYARLTEFEKRELYAYPAFSEAARAAAEKPLPEPNPRRRISPAKSKEPKGDVSDAALMLGSETRLAQYERDLRQARRPDRSGPFDITAMMWGFLAALPAALVLFLYDPEGLAASFPALEPFVTFPVIAALAVVVGLGALGRRLWWKSGGIQAFGLGGAAAILLVAMFSAGPETTELAAAPSAPTAQVGPLRDLPLRDKVASKTLYDAIRMSDGDPAVSLEEFSRIEALPRKD